ncbi:MAG: FkbM family methyltransferase [Sporichthyaceae bacterium]
MRATKAIRPVVRRLGLDLTRYPENNHTYRFARLLQTHRIATVLDVGANVGQFASGLREFGYRGEIHSFEPMAAEFAELARRAAGDSAWFAHRLGLGDVAGEAEVNVSANSVSSSMLPMCDEHLLNAPQSAYTGTETIPVDTLDALLERGVFDTRGRAVLKVDTQGFERQVLAGGPQTIEWVQGIHIEASCVPLYEGQMLLPEVVAFFERLGMVVEGVELGFTSTDGRMLQMDLIAFRPEARVPSARTSP